jgi:hypothetical protein
MASHDIGGITFSATPVSVMKCFVGIGWAARGKKESIDEYRKFSDEFFPFLIRQDNDKSLDAFCGESVAKIDDIAKEHVFTTDLVNNFTQQLKNTLNSPRNKMRVVGHAKEYDAWIQSMLRGTFGKVACAAVQKLRSFGVKPTRRRVVW